MLYKELPYYKVYMRCEKIIPTSYCLPSGYTMVHYPQASKEDWCRIQMECGHVESIKDAQQIFEREFASDIELATSRLLFVLNEDKQAVGTAALWKGKDGFPKDRLHWIGVCDTETGKGIAKYLIQEACKLASGVIYLDSQTWSYPAIHLYQTFGFVRWNATNSDDDYKGWDILDSCFTVEEEG